VTDEVEDVRPLEGVSPREDEEDRAEPADIVEQAPDSTPRSSKSVKSLKCQECGTLNMPTEWYCERCGAELAAM